MNPFKLDPNHCGGCQMAKFRLENGIRNANCCRFCINIDMTHAKLIDAINEDDYFNNHVYCTKHKILMLKYEICDSFDDGEEDIEKRYVF